jgi:hypothetical protein
VLNSHITLQSTYLQVLHSDIDLLNPPAELEKQKHKLKRLVQSPNSYFMVRRALRIRWIVLKALEGRRRPWRMAVARALFCLCGLTRALLSTTSRSPSSSHTPHCFVQQDVKCQGCFNM